MYRRCKRRWSGRCGEAEKMVGIDMSTRRSIVIGSDTCGLDLRDAVRDHLLYAGYLVTDMSGSFGGPANSLAIARGVASAVADDDRTRGVLIIGGRANVAIAASQVPGVRAVHVSDTSSIE